MSANTNPRYTLVGDISSDGTQTSTSAMAPTVLTATGDYTGVSTNHKLVFTAGANGARIVGLHFQAVGTNLQSVARIYLNNGGTNTTSTNNSFIGAQTLIGTSSSNTVAEIGQDWLAPGGFIDLPPGAKIYTGLATTVASGYAVSAIQGGQF